jgi:hypothetical protein
LRPHAGERRRAAVPTVDQGVNARSAAKTQPNASTGALA